MNAIIKDFIKFYCKVREALGFRNFAKYSERLILIRNYLIT